MAKIILNVAVSLDGFIEGPNGEFDWCFDDQDYGLTPFLAETEMIFYGQKSYELIISIKEKSFIDYDNYVFSKSLIPQNQFHIEKYSSTIPDQ